MKVVVQRVLSASVSVDEKVVSAIKNGLLILVGIAEDDAQIDIEWLSKKIVNLRIFNDENDQMNNSIIDVNGDILAVSQFTLMASTKKGNRPSYIKAAKPEIATPMYQAFINRLEIDLKKKIETGIFGAMMQVDLVNDGPVTILIDSRQKE